MPPATRIGDADITHCSPPSRMIGSHNVKVNGIPWSRQGDINFPHLLPCGPGCCTHVAPITSGSSTVKVNGRGAGRVSDAITACTFVSVGSSNVRAGG